MVLFSATISCIFSLSAPAFLSLSSAEKPAPGMAYYHFTPILLFNFLFVPSAAFNITALLAPHPEISSFAKLLTSSSVAGELTGRSSVTILAVPNPYLLRSDALRFAGDDIADVLRYHILLEYLSWPDLHRIPPSGKLITTLYQTTGRATSNLGAVNLTRNPINGAVSVRSPAPFLPSNATVVSLVASVPYNISVLLVDAFLMPYGFDLAASETRPPAILNITQVLLAGGDFNVAASMLEASGVVEEFERDEHGAGITVFVPTDEAFAGLPATERLQSLPAERKAAVLKFHVLHSYYPLGSLESIVNPVQPTVATEDSQAQWFTMNISRVNGSVEIDTGVVQARITRTVYDENPVAVFAVSKVLLPREVFGEGGERGVVAAESPEGEAEAPEDAAGERRLRTPPGRGEMVSVGGTGLGFWERGVCTGLVVLGMLVGDLGGYGFFVL